MPRSEKTSNSNGRRGKTADRRREIGDRIEKAMLDIALGTSDTAPEVDSGRKRLQHVFESSSASRAEHDNVDEDDETDDDVGGTSRDDDLVQHIFSHPDGDDALRQSMNVALTRAILRNTIATYNNHLRDQRSKESEIKMLRRINGWRIMRANIIASLLLGLEVLRRKQQLAEENGGDDEMVVDSHFPFKVNSMIELLKHALQCSSMEAELENDAKFDCAACDERTRVHNTYGMRFVNGYRSPPVSHKYYLCASCYDAVQGFFALVYHFDGPVTQGTEQLREWMHAARQREPDRVLPITAIKTACSRFVAQEIQSLLQHIRNIRDKFGACFVVSLTPVQALHFASTTLIDLYDLHDDRQFVGFDTEDASGAWGFPKCQEAIDRLREINREKSASGDDIEVVPNVAKKNANRPDLVSEPFEIREAQESVNKRREPDERNPLPGAKRAKTAAGAAAVARRKKKKRAVADA